MVELCLNNIIINGKMLDYHLDNIIIKWWNGRLSFKNIIVYHFISVTYYTYSSNIRFKKFSFSNSKFVLKVAVNDVRTFSCEVKCQQCLVRGENFNFFSVEIWIEKKNCNKSFLDNSQKANENLISF
jgi:hypothetical protein